MKLRGHHLLCLQGFQGYGYNEAFVDHLTQLTTRLRQNPSTTVELTEGMDSVCLACPRNVDAVCRDDPTSDQAISRMDIEVLNAIEQSAGSQASYAELINAANQVFPSQAKADKVCGDCGWKAQCLWYLSRESGNDVIIKP
jgi:hypothetical protein